MTVPEPTWTPRELAAITARFTRTSGLNYYDFVVRIRSLAENAAVVVDNRGMERVVPYSSMSFASEYIARQNIGAFVTLKIRGWE